MLVKGLILVASAAADKCQVQPAYPANGPAVTVTSLVKPSVSITVSSVAQTSVSAPVVITSISAPAVTSSASAPAVSVTSTFTDSKTTTTTVTTSAVPNATIGAKCNGATLVPSNPSKFWMEEIEHNGSAAYNPDPNYKIFRNVKDFGAKGDGITDDTEAIMAALASGNRCGKGCDSSTTTGALVYVPPGTYIISGPLKQYYMTQFVGSAVNPPTIKAAPNFSGMALIDADPYEAGGINWHTNQNNFMRQIRNLILDTTAMPAEAYGTGIHWQVAQVTIINKATSIRNVVFESSRVKGNNHQGIFMDNGSGGYFADLVFNGGKYGVFGGTQQFTSKNLVFNGVDTAIFINWDWTWSFSNIKFNNCRIAIDLTAGGEDKLQAGSLVLLDSEINNTEVGILTAKSEKSFPVTAASLVVDNVKLNNVKAAIKSTRSSEAILDGSATATVIKSWGQGTSYGSGAKSGSYFEGELPGPKKSQSLIDSTGAFVQRSQPEYKEYAASDFINVKNFGAKGDGKSDDTVAIQNILNDYAGCKIIYFPAGAYVLTSTVTVPAGSRIIGEVWSTFAAHGDYFGDQKNPKVMLKVGNEGESGLIEISDILFSHVGPIQGAILLEWNIRDLPGQQASAALWDTHFRIGGADGTQLQSAQCTKEPSVPKTSVNPNCYGAFMLMHITKTASAYVDNMWAWTADHDFDGKNNQIDIYTGRGILSESEQGPVWMWGTASEHNVFYQYSFVNSSNVFMSIIQTETPYYQPNPTAAVPYLKNDAFYDPDFTTCTGKDCFAWALRIIDTTDLFLYGAGLYNFFDNYDQKCLKTNDCQSNIVQINNRQENSGIYIFNLNTKASISMLTKNGKAIIQQNDNLNSFTQTVMAILNV